MKVGGGLGSRGILSSILRVQAYSRVPGNPCPGCDKDGVHLPQTSSFGQWTSGLSILLVLWTSESSGNK